MTNILKLEIGKEVEMKEKDDFKIDRIDIKDIDVNGDKTKKVVFVCTNPVSGKELNLSEVRYTKAGKIVKGGLWVSLDKDGNIAYNSALANLMRFLKVSNLEDLKEIPVWRGDLSDNYWIVNAI